MPSGELAGTDRFRRPLIGRLAKGLAVAASLAVLFGPTLAASKDAPPVPRVSPIKDGSAAGADPAETGDIAAEGDNAGDGVLLPPGDIPEPGDAALEPFDDGTGPQPPDPDAPIALTPDGAGAADAPVDLRTGTTPPAATETDSSGLGTLSLEARLTEQSPVITAGMTWRVFDSEPGPDGRMRLVGEAHGGTVTLKLKPGEYFIHASYGRAGIAKKVKVASAFDNDTIVLNAGGMRLSALAGKDRSLGPEDVNFDIYAPDESGAEERSLVVSRAPPDSIIGLRVGVYHVVCRYGDANAVVRADIKVEAGRLTEATVFQKAARMTLKLVSEHGGEALANTVWSVVTPSGDSVAESVGAFPSVVLAEGKYTAIAKHDGKIFEREFDVEPGVDRDVEVLVKPE